ncbi:MAG: class I SAM-dependent methyltransferase [Gemmatimonadota bacterium]
MTTELIERPRSCRLCSAQDLDVAYEGRIRAGKPGNLTEGQHTVWRCASCGVGFLGAAIEVDYESGEYRTLVDGSVSVEQFYALHDPEQQQKLEAIGLEIMRNAVVMDVGCGAGSFLDLVKGFSQSTIGIEPTEAYHSTLTAKGHLAFPYCTDVTDAWRGQVDLATCFSVIEHVDDPVDLVESIRRQLGSNGELILSTPNHRDWLLELLPQEYAAFFYRTVHKWYFDERSIRHLARAAGFRKCEVSYHQRFDWSNFALWLRDKKPTGNGKLQVARAVDLAFRNWLEEEGRADYIYARLQA